MVVLTVDILRTDEDRRRMSVEQRDKFILPDSIRRSPLLEGLRIKPEEEGLGPKPKPQPTEPTTAKPMPGCCRRRSLRRRNTAHDRGFTVRPSRSRRQRARSPRRSTVRASSGPRTPPRRPEPAPRFVNHGASEGLNSPALILVAARRSLPARLGNDRGRSVLLPRIASSGGLLLVPPVIDLKGAILVSCAWVRLP